MTNPAYGRLIEWMQLVVTHPRTAAEGANTAAAQAIVPGAHEGIDQVILPTEQLTGLERLAIYARAYHARLRDCLEEDHGALWYATRLACVDDDDHQRLMVRLVGAYADEHPSHHPSLDRFGHALSPFLAGSSWPELARLQPRGFFAELAGLERTQVELFHQPDPEPLSPEALRALAPEGVLDAHIELAPSTRLARNAYPVHAFMVAWVGGEQPGIPAPAAEHLAYWKRDFRVWRIPLRPAGYGILRALQKGRTVGRALEIGLRIAGKEAADAPQAFIDRVFESFREWTEEGIFSAVRRA